MCYLYHFTCRTAFSELLFMLSLLLLDRPQQEPLAWISLEGTQKHNSLDLLPHRWNGVVKEIESSVYF